MQLNAVIQSCAELNGIKEPPTDNKINQKFNNQELDLPANQVSHREIKQGTNSTPHTKKTIG